MQMSAAGIAMIQDHEGLRLKAYLDPVGVWTIGYGHTRRVRPGMTITLAEANAFLAQDIADAEDCVNRSVTVPLTQGQFDALVSFTFNLGCGALRRSALLKYLNAGHYEKTANQFGRWVHGGGRVLGGLVRRREDERQMFVQEVV